MIMPAPNGRSVDLERAKQIWAEYQQQHDVSGRLGQTAGIDPVSGRVWFGTSAEDIWRQQDAEGIDAPCYYVRVGKDYYLRKGKRKAAACHGCVSRAAPSEDRR
jgi:hypothetical protein